MIATLGNLVDNVTISENEPISDNNRSDGEKVDDSDDGNSTAPTVVLGIIAGIAIITLIIVGIFVVASHLRCVCSYK